MNLHLHSLDDNCVLSRVRFESQITWYRFHKKEFGGRVILFSLKLIHLPMPFNASVVEAICSTPNF